MLLLVCNYMSLRNLYLEVIGNLLAKMPYESTIEYPELHEAECFAKERINSLRNEYGFHQMNFSDSDVRLIAPATFDEEIKPFEERRLTGYFEPTNRICYIRFVSEAEMSPYAVIKNMYMIIHELFHEGNDGDGIRKYSIDIDEGMVDFHARNMMRELIPKILSEDDFLANKCRIEAAPQDFNDVLMAPPRGEAILYGYVPQIHLIEAIVKSKPEVFNNLVKASLSEDVEGAEKQIADNYGENISAYLHQNTIPIDEITSLISNPKSNVPLTGC